VQQFFCFLSIFEALYPIILVQNLHPISDLGVRKQYYNYLCIDTSWLLPSNLFGWMIANSHILNSNLNIWTGSILPAAKTVVAAFLKYFCYTNHALLAYGTGIHHFV
jgi:hypothetical protein